MSKVLFWDFDGSLVYANERFIDTFLSVTNAFNYNFPKDEIRQLFKSIYPWNFPEISYQDRIGDFWWDSFLGKIDNFYAEKGISQSLKKEINEKFKFQMINNNTYTLYEDAKDTLSAGMELGYKNCILSNNYPELPRILDDFNISHFFTDYFVSALIGYEKPRSELFDYAIKKSGCKSGYMIGDNPIADIEGGKNAGLKTILVHRGNISTADYKLDHLCQIPEILKCS